VVFHSGKTTLFPLRPRVSNKGDKYDESKEMTGFLEDLFGRGEKDRLKQGALGSLLLATSFLVQLVHHMQGSISHTGPSTHKDCHIASFNDFFTSHSHL